MVIRLLMWSPAASALAALQRLYAKKLCETSKSLTVKVVLHTQAAPGSHGALPGTPKRALHSAPTAPTTRGSPDAISRRGKGVNPFPPRVTSDVTTKFATSRIVP